MRSDLVSSLSCRRENQINRIAATLAIKWTIFAPIPLTKRFILPQQKAQDFLPKFVPFETSEKWISECRVWRSYSGFYSSPRCSSHQTRRLRAECPPELYRAANHRSQVTS